MNCRISANLGAARECGGQCEGERRYVQASSALERELEWRDQERLAIAELVDQAHLLLQEVISGERGTEVLALAGSQLARASQLLNWPLPFEPAGSS
jgi:23S rRNA A2030 N6-methylase RlmJ